MRGDRELGPSLIFIFLVIFLLSSIVIAKTIINRKNIPCMTGMMIAMANGMSVGLVLGVIFGILLTGNLFLTTMIGMVFGMVTGFLSGMPVSLMAVLDGLLSGMMGGLMGAMFGEMISLEYHEAVVKVMFILFFATMLIVINLIQKEVKKKEISFPSNPLILVALFGLIFIIFDQLGPVFL
jgi:hypothetical protein